MTELIHLYYGELCKYGYLITDLYNLTIAELDEMLEERKQGHDYKLCKQYNLIATACFSKNYPETPEKASPELYPPKKKFKRPDFLKGIQARKE